MKALIELLGSLSLLVATWVYLPHPKSTTPPRAVTAAAQWIPASSWPLPSTIPPAKEYHQ